MGRLQKAQRNKSSPIKVLVSVCNNPPWIHKRVVFVLLKLQQDPRYQVTIILPTWKPYEQALNRVVKDMCEVYKDHDFWLNIDADNPPINNPLDLVELDKDVIGLPTPVWHDAVKGDQPYYYNALVEKEGTEGWKPAIGEGLTEVDVVGSGCMLIHRRVIKTVKRPLFMREYDEDGIVDKGHDYLFCEKAQSCGFKVWTHFGYPCEHYVENDLHSQINAFHRVDFSQNGGHDPIIVVGPPRSGSSSVAKLLVKLGVFMGDKYLYLKDNVESGGTFEDADVAELSKQAVANNIDQQEWRRKFKKLAEKRKDKVWGFKDPRTYKLIDEYLEYFDSPVFIRCHRKKSEVVASMMRVFEWNKNKATITYDKIEEILDEKLKGKHVINTSLDELNNGVAEKKIKSIIQI